MGQRRRKERGATLAEAATVIALCAVLAATAAPAMSGLIDRQRLRGSADELRADLQYLRSEAVQRGQTLWVAVHRSGTGACYVLHTGARQACRCSPQGTAECVEGAQALKTVGFPSDGPLQLTSTSAAFSFEPLRGIATPTASLQLALASGEAVQQVVSVMGRVRSCSPAGRLPGLPAC